MKTEIEQGPLKSFGPFPKVPIELRTKIWKLCLPQATTVPLEAYALQNQPFDMGFTPNTNNLASALLRVCKESRKIFIKHLPYKLPLDIKDARKGYHRGLESVRFGEVDTIHIDGFDAIYPKHQSLLSKQNWVAKVRKLSISVNNTWKVDWSQLLDDFKSVRRLEIEVTLVFLPKTWLSRHWIESEIGLESLREYWAGDENFPEIVVKEVNTFRVME